MTNWRHWLRNFMLASFVLMLAGCGSTSKSTDTPTGPGGGSGNNPSPYVGQASLSGTVVANDSDVNKVKYGEVTTSNATQSIKKSSLELAQYQMRRSAIMASFRPVVLSAIPSTGLIDDAVAKLYELSATGGMIYTGITTNCDASSYNFHHIADGKKYIVEIEKIGYEMGNASPNVLKITAPAIIPKGVLTASANVSPQTKLATSMLVTNIVSVAKGAGISDSVIDLLVRTVEDTVKTMLDSGLISFPTAVEKYTPPAPTEDRSSQVAQLSKEEQAVADQLANVKEINDIKEEAKIQATVNKDLDNLTLEEAAKLIRDLFGEKQSSNRQSQNDGSAYSSTGGNQNIPDYFVQAFAAKMLAGTTVNIQTFAATFYAHQISNTYTQQQIEDLMRGAAKTALTKLYTYYDAPAGTTLSYDEVPAAVRAVFPKDNRWVLDPSVSVLQVMNVPQTLLVMMEAGFIETGDDKGGPPFDPIGFCKALGFMDASADNSYINWFEVRPVEIYMPESMSSVNSKWKPVMALQSSVELTMDSTFVGTINRVVLEYPAVGGITKSIDYKEMNYNQGNYQPGSIKVSVDSVKAAGLEKSSAIRKSAVATKSGGGETNKSFRLEPWFWYDQNMQDQNAAYRVTDFVSGKAVVKVYKQGSATPFKTQEVNLINPTLTPISWIYPKGPDQAKIAAFNFDDQFTAAELDVNDSGKATPRFEWSAPVGDIPAGTRLAYAVNLGKQIRKLNWNQPWSIPASEVFTRYENSQAVTLDGIVDESWSLNTWKNIWNTWNENRFVNGTSFTLGFSLDPTTRNVLNNYETLYNIEVSPVIIDNETEAVLWEGSRSHNEFKVGASSWEIRLRGQIGFPSKNILAQWAGEPSWNQQSMMTVHVLPPGVWKLGLFRMNGSQNGQWKDYFWDMSSANARSPLSISGNRVMAVLGTTDEVAGKLVSYNLYTITKASKALKSGEYQLVLWYDLATKPASWTDNYLNMSNPVSNNIDVGINRWSNMGGYELVERLMAFDFRARVYADRVEFDSGVSSGQNGNTMGDLTDPTNQWLPLNLAEKLRQWGFVGAENNFEFGTGTGGGASVGAGASDTNAQAPFKNSSTGLIELSMKNKFVNGVAANVELPSGLKYISIIDPMDKQEVAYTDAFVTSNLLNKVFFRFSKMKDLTGTQLEFPLPAKEYIVAVYSDLRDNVLASGTTTPSIVCEKFYMDDWFLSLAQTQDTLISGNYVVSANFMHISLNSPLTTPVKFISLRTMMDMPVCNWQLASTANVGDTTINLYLGMAPIQGKKPEDIVTGNYMVAGGPSQLEAPSFKVYKPGQGVDFDVINNPTTTNNQDGGSAYLVLGNWSVKSGTMVSINAFQPLPESIYQIALYVGIPVHSICTWNIAQSPGIQSFTLDTAGFLAAGALPADPNWMSDVSSNYVFKGIGIDGKTIVLCAPRSTENIQQHVVHGIYSDDVMATDIAIDLPEPIQANVSRVLLREFVNGSWITLGYWNKMVSPGTIGSIHLIKGTFVGVDGYVLPTPSMLMASGNYRFLGYGSGVIVNPTLSDQAVFAGFRN